MSDSTHPVTFVGGPWNKRPCPSFIQKSKSLSFFLDVDPAATIHAYTLIEPLGFYLYQIGNPVRWTFHFRDGGTSLVTASPSTPFHVVVRTMLKSRLEGKFKDIKPIAVSAALDEGAAIKVVLPTTTPAPAPAPATFTPEVN